MVNERTRPEPKRFEVWQVALDPTIGSEISNVRPCVVISPDQMNAVLATVIVAPLTSTHKRWPSRVVAEFGGRTGDIALDHIRSVDKQRLRRRLGTLDPTVAGEVLETLVAMFQA